MNKSKWGHRVIHKNKMRYKFDFCLSSEKCELRLKCKNYLLLLTLCILETVFSVKKN